MTDESERDVVRRTLDTDADEPAAQVADTVAELEDRDITDLESMYHCVDNVLDHLFSNPPSDEADMEISFDYEGYRVVVRQDGRARFVPAD